MPSARDLADLRAQIREATTQSIAQDMPADELDAHLQRVGEAGGRQALSFVVLIALSGMHDLRKASPDARMGGIAGHLQRSLVRFGEPYKTVGNDLTAAMRLLNEGDKVAANRALDDAWAKWGALGVSLGITLIVTLYGEVARARRVTLSEAWSTATAHDQAETEAYLAKPVIVAEQGLWDAGFDEDDMAVVLARMQTLVIGVQESEAESVAFADMATTPERKTALLGFMAAFTASSS
jgi:hypothetical protein